MAVTGHWQGGFDEPKLAALAESLRKRLAGPVDLALVFMTPDYFSDATQALEIIRVHARAPLLAGCSGAGLIEGGQERENASGLVLGLYSLPQVRLKAHWLTPEQLDAAEGPAYWHAKTGDGPADANGWLVFADPYTFNAEEWLQQWNLAYPDRPILGGLASGRADDSGTRLFLDGEVFDQGAVVISVGGRIHLKGVVSQGCTPIGEPWTITRAQQHFIQEIGNRPAYKVLADTFGNLAAKEQRRTRGNLFVGLVVNEYLEQFQRGDFLIRNLLGGDPKTGILAVGALPRPGQTMQFQRRDAEAATEDLLALLEKARVELSGRTVYGGCLFCCGGRGRGLFGADNHDAALVQQHLGPLGLTGFFCNGEIGPVGNRNFLHGYTASLALFHSA